MKVTYTFEFQDGSRVSYEAETLREAMEMRNKEFGERPWTLVQEGRS